ncbi:calcium-activated potassium channel subunit beta-2-like isoform X1 [Dunckerocampus dactyliophorus]|uniref:calcium-activated potassium channel subunit beta-2-like isoform X1 n=1 Tax=Dunckerocampus dactyliophorus TaxID=161453 RepID=UPI00240711DF|nr:calcium-activated potassium channel subunit beta-2-like isoform X1 [Dunckerocampus dactyliophorus]XP_054624030.1 calcium-activated potassium channel subunit beta-2-like isoform X1 [Dunckerocampus dactyliophorus]
MFFVAGAKNTASGGGNERRSIYQKFREVDLLDKKKTVTALKPGEDRAILLGLGMIFSSVMMFFVLGITILRSYADSVWTEEGVCVVLNSTVTADMNCSYNCGSDCWRVSKYPCLQVYVNVNNTGRITRLSHNEETQDASSEVPEGQLPNAQHDHEHLRAPEGQPAGPMLLRPQRAAGDSSADPSLRSQRRVPLAAVALVHVCRRGPHNCDGQAHTVPLQAVRRDREDQEVKRLYSQRRKPSDHSVNWHS